MKRIYIFLIFTLLVFTGSIANELENTLNKVYEKSSKAAEGYISNLLSGPGDTEVSIGKKRANKPTGTIMIVRPYKVEKDNVLFYQVQFNSFHVGGDARQSLNYGVGKRFLSDNKSHFWGINTFFDLDVEKNSRVGLGSEFKASAFEVNGNYYLDAFGGMVNETGGGNKVDSNTERVLDGYDLNVSGQVPFTPWANINYNKYTWKAEEASKSSEGEIYSAMVDLSNDLAIEFGRDDNNITNYRNYAKLIYTPNSKNKPNWDDGFSGTAFQNSDVSKKMLTKVKRSNIITLEIESTGVVIVNGN